MTLHHSHRHEQASITAGPPRPQTVLLSCSVAVLLGGMVFQSAALDAGSAGYALLTVAVACTIVAAVFLFVWMLAVETRRTCRRDVPALLTELPLTLGFVAVLELQLAHVVAARATLLDEDRYARLLAARGLAPMEE